MGHPIVHVIIEGNKVFTPLTPCSLISSKDSSFTIVTVSVSRLVRQTVVLGIRFICNINVESSWSWHMDTFRLIFVVDKYLKGSLNDLIFFSLICCTFRNQGCDCQFPLFEFWAYLNFTNRLLWRSIYCHGIYLISFEITTVDKIF